MNSDISSSIDRLVGAYLDPVDTEAPGLVAGLYLTGSIALHDFRPGQSDVDFVAVTPAHPDEAALGALQRVHTMLTARFPQPSFEGIYLTWDDLAQTPAGCRPVPYVRDRRFVPSGRFELSPVTWITLARHGVRVRGPQPDALPFWDDPATLDQWTRENLEQYWQPWLAQRGRLTSGPGLGALRPWATAWGALGVSRLHHTLTSGQITSEYGAGLYAMRRFSPRWHPILIEALRIRRGDRGRSAYATPLGRRRDLLAYVAMVIHDALDQPPRIPTRTL